MGDPVDVAALKAVLAEHGLSNALFLSKEDREKIETQLNWNTDKLGHTWFRIAQEFAHCSVSKFFVGCAFLGGSGAMYAGFNVEIVGDAINHCVHAEQFAAANVFLRKLETHLERLFVSAAPCGHCRQFMCEINKGDQISITFQDVLAPLHELLPRAFMPTALGNDHPLLAHPTQTFTLESIQPATSDAHEDLAAALDALNYSYAPYTNCYAGVLVTFEDGTTSTGSYFENAAFNPSILPLESALIGHLSRCNADLSQDKRNIFAKIARVTLIERRIGLFSVRAGTASILAAIAPNATLHYHTIE